MKTKLFLLASLFLFSFFLFPCEAQVPQGFNYQAIARDPSNGNNPITGATMQVKIGILSDTIANTLVWEELFNPVKTNAFGMFNIVVGTGVKQSGSSTSFSSIDWTKTPMFLRTSVYFPDTWKVMGTTKLQSVPYSMVAASLEGTVPLLSVKGNTTTMDSALFVVRNNTGQIVFAVYNEGVRIFVDDGVAKGATKGGFAIGSFDKSKGTSQPLFVVDGDSIRAYINDVGKATKGGFAIGSFDKSKGGNINFLNVATDANGVINPSQNRILWYPIKNAFLTGKVLIEGSDSVGLNSFASGYESKAKGQYSQALGYQAIARGLYSTAIGYQSVAHMDNSFAFGQWAQATNSESYAIGRGAIASGYRSFAFGSAGVDQFGNTTGVAFAKGDYSFAIGQGSQSLGRGSFALGLADTSRGNYSLGMGYWTTASGDWSTAMGILTIASGSSSTAMGGTTNAIGNYSTSMGTLTTAGGPCSLATGYNTNTSGTDAVAMGFYTKAKPFASLCLGMFNDTTCSTDGNHLWIATDPVFIIGNGSWFDNRGNAFTVLKNGNTAIGHASPTQMLDVNGNARFRAVGSGTFAYNLNIMGDGTLTTATSDISMKENIIQISDALDRVTKLRGVFFNWKSDSTKTKQIGMIAQEVEPIVPEIVFTNPVDGLKGINYSQASALFVEAIKEQQKQIEVQQQQIESTKQENQQLRSELDELKALVNTLVANQTSQGNK